MSRILCDDELAFLRTIHADPADDLPRLVFADWLEETGDPMLAVRGQLIRSQILAAGGNHPDRNSARQASDSILQTHMIEWWKELPQIDGVVWGWFKRGFPEHAIVTKDAYLRDYEAIFGLLPITSVRIGGILLEEMGSLLDRGVSANLRKLSIGTGRTRHSFRIDSETGRIEYLGREIPSTDGNQCLRSVRRMISMDLHRMLTDLTLDDMQHYPSEVRELLFKHFPPHVLSRE